MAKFRCRTSKGKRWAKGQASSSNPIKTKYRDLAQSRFFKENLGDTGLTQDALQRHNTVMAHRKINSTQKSEAETELAIAKDLENMSMRPEDNDDEKTESEISSWSQSQSNKTFKTFASSWSQCTNASFNKFFNKFDEKNALHKSMLAVLATATEIINKEGGKESNETYYAVLMIMLKTVQDEADLTATVALLALGIKSVPQVVLRKMFSDSAKTFMDILKKNMETASPGLLQNLIGCLSVLLRAQNYTTWDSSSTMDVFNHILGFTLYSKPWVRKVAQRAVHSVLVRSCFMTPEDENAKIPPVHPAAEHVAKFCSSQLTAKALVAGYRTVCYTLNILKLVLPLFTKKDIKTTCESILALMAQNNVYIKTNALHALHELFASRAPRCQLGGATAAQLCRALAAARPAGTDAAQALAWGAVMQQAYSCLARLDLNLCLPNLPFFVGICVSELWLADLQKVNDAATNALKMLLVDCVKPAVESEETFTSHKHHIETVIRSIGAGLDNPFNKAIRHVILTIATCFEIGNHRLAYLLGPLLTKLVERRETDNFHHQAEVECATGCAVKSLGPEFVLTHVQLRDGPESINLERSWLLPVLKKNITHSRLKYFSTEILQMATFCRRKSRELTAAQDNTGSHTYELLCNQLWSLLPSFCNYPTDIKDSFKEIAKLLGTVLKQNPEFRVSIMQGLRRLITCSAENEQDKAELARFSKNYVPILLNLYLTPVTGNTAKGVSLATLETIQVYLTITEQALQDEFYQRCLQNLRDFQDKQYQREATLDVIRLLVLYQDARTLGKLFNNWLLPLCTSAPELPKLNVKKSKVDQEKEQKEAKMDEDQEAEVSQEIKKQRRAQYKLKLRRFEKEQKKAFRILVEIMSSDRENCKTFCREYEGRIKELLLATATGKHAAASGKIWRLRCLELVIKSSQSAGAVQEEQFLKYAIAQAVVSTRDINAACRQRARALLAGVADVMHTAAGDAGVRKFAEYLRAGLGAGETRVATATLVALTAAAERRAGQLGAGAMRALLDDVLGLMGREDTELAAAAVAFLKMYIKAMDRALVEDSLPAIMSALYSMPDACKRSTRTRTGYLLHAMLRKYGDAALRAAVPPADTATLARLRNLRKLESRKRTLKGNRNNETEETNTDLDAPMKATAATIEDILKDSDSEVEMAVEEEDRPKKKSKAARKNSTWIQENADDIVDLADVSAARKITGTDPSVKRVAEDKTQKKKECTFRTAPDGRLIISDDVFGDDDDDDDKASGDDDEDSDDSDNDKVDPEKQKRLVRTGQKRRHDDAASVRSGATARSGASVRGGAYRPGGRGIHRPLGSSASVASASFGAEYKAKKAQGDVTRKGRPQPYAYIPLDRKNMNKRNRHLNAKQFKGVVKAKTRVGKRKQR